MAAGPSGILRGQEHVISGGKARGRRRHFGRCEAETRAGPLGGGGRAGGARGEAAAAQRVGTRWPWRATSTRRSGVAGTGGG